MGKISSAFTAGLLVGILVATVGFSLFMKYQRNSGGQVVGQRVLRLAHNLPTDHPVHLAMESMKERLEELSSGSLSLEINSGGVEGSETECLEALQDGTLDLTKTSAAAIENFIPSMAVFSLPYVFRDRTHFWSVLEGEIGQDLLEQAREGNLKGLCYYDAGSRNFYTKDTPIRTPDDLKGLKIRVMSSETAIKMIKAMGGSPTAIPFNDLYSSLETGVVDGAENNPPSFTSHKHFEVAKHFTLDGHSRIPDMLLISSIIWDELSPQQQGWVQQAALESSQLQRELWEKESVACLERAKENDVTVYEVDTALFAAKVQPMLEQIEDEKVKTLLNQIRKVK